MPLAGDDRLLLSIIGMSTCLGAVVRAPFTSILIVFEMTRQFSLIPALLVAGILSQALCRWLQPVGFYEQVLEDDGHLLSTVVPPRDFREWEGYPVSAIANYHPVVLADLEIKTLEAGAGKIPLHAIRLPGGRQPPGVILRQEMVEAVKHEARPCRSTRARPACEPIRSRTSSACSSNPSTASCWSSTRCGPRGRVGDAARSAARAAKFRRAARRCLNGDFIDDRALH